MDHSTERWLPIDGHDGYEVSNHGRVRSYRVGNGQPERTEPKILAGSWIGPSKALYHAVKLAPDFQMKKVHHLVLKAFVGPRPTWATLVRHLDGDPSNNHVANLVWGTAEQNYADRHRHGTHNSGSRNGRTSLTESQVAEIRRQLQAGALRAELAVRYGVTKSVINHIATRTTWSHVA